MPPPLPRPQLFVRLLGTPVWWRPAGVPTALARKDAALLARLALDGPQPQPTLCDLVWPDSSAVQAAANLRQRAMRLKAEAGVPFIEVGPTVRLHADVDCDVANLRALSDEVLLACGSLLAGIDLGDHDALDRWLAQARTRVGERCAELLADGAEALERAGRLHEALAIARRIVDLAPFAEQGWRRLIRLHYLRGDRAAAQDAYWRLHDQLRDELGIRPSAETLRLFQTVETDAAAPPLPRRPLPASLLRPPVLVGRHAAWAAMASAWQLPQPILVVAEAGLGKSRLLEAFLHGQDGLVAERARPGDRQSPDALLGRLLHQVEQRFAPRCSAATRAELARLRPEFGAPPAAPANEAILRRALEDWLVAALAAGLRGLAIDDLHNVDTSLLETLRWLASSPALADLRLVLASRPWADDDAGAVLAGWLTDSHRPVRVDLQPLSRDELSLFLASLALPELVDEQAASRLYRHAGGHPLYTLATLQHAMASGAALGPPSTLPPVASVQALLDARIRALPPLCRDLLPVAAVGGAELSVERAARLLKCEPLALVEAWGALEAHNVLQGEAFSHDLVHEAALRAVPLGVQQSLHRQWAALLAEEQRLPPAMVALHWEQGLRWSEAGHAWHAAAAGARLAGRLNEQTALFERAARCHAQAGDAGARFEALAARLDGLHLRSGGSAVLAALHEVEALADTSERRLRCRVARTEALLDQFQADDAAAESARALAEVAPESPWEIDVRAQRAIALAQVRRPEDALDNALQAVALARRRDEPVRCLRAFNALMYVHWSAGRLADAVAAQAEELAVAEALGDRALAAVSQGSLAALLASTGDLRDTHAHASSAQARQREMGLGDNSTQVILNHTVLGAAAAALGRFDDGLAALQQALALAGHEAGAAVRAMAAVALGRVWLMLGRPEAARAAAAEVGTDAPPGLQMQAAYVLARAAQAEDKPAAPWWSQFDRLAAAHGALAPGQSITFESSFNGNAAAAIDRLGQERDACERLGLRGVARALRWREMMCWLELPGAPAADAALACARALHEHADAGLSHKCYPPETWLGLARAHERAGDAVTRDACLDAGRRWLQQATDRLAPEHREAFHRRNAVNRALLAQAPTGR